MRGLPPAAWPCQWACPKECPVVLQAGKTETLPSEPPGPHLDRPSSSTALISPDHGKAQTHDWPRKLHHTRGGLGHQWTASWLDKGSARHSPSLEPWRGLGESVTQHGGPVAEAHGLASCPQCWLTGGDGPAPHCQEAGPAYDAAGKPWSRVQDRAQSVPCSLLPGPRTRASLPAHPGGPPRPWSPGPGGATAGLPGTPTAQRSVSGTAAGHGVKGARHSPPAPALLGPCPFEASVSD